MECIAYKDHQAFYIDSMKQGDLSFQSTDPLTTALIEHGITTWSLLLGFLRNLKYERISNAEDLSLVVKENKGTCSSKHGLAKKVAELNNFSNVDLILCMYKMSDQNTPGIGSEYKSAGLPYIPEAHCYLKVEGKVIDLTEVNSNHDLIRNDILEELDIDASQIPQFKKQYHQNFIKNWITKNKIPISYEALWELRESCIMNLSR